MGFEKRQIRIEMNRKTEGQIKRCRQGTGVERDRKKDIQVDRYYFLNKILNRQFKTETGRATVSK